MARKSYINVGFKKKRLKSINVLKTLNNNLVTFL